MSDFKSSPACRRVKVFTFTLIKLFLSKTCQICASLFFQHNRLPDFATTLLRPAGYGGQDWSKTTPLFLKKGEGLGEGKNLFSREKKFFPSPIKPFTLIELLVVIAIIAILAALLLPALQQSRKRGKQAGCLSNLKQCGTWILQYYDDYNNAPCDRNAWGSDHLTIPGWLTILYGTHVYIKDGTWAGNQRRPIMTKTPWVCPELDETNAATTEVKFGTSYARVQEAFCRMSNSKPYGPTSTCKEYGGAQLNLKRMRKPSKVLLFADQNQAVESAIISPGALTYGSGSCVVAFRHAGKTVDFLFGDGHSEARSRNEADKNVIFKTTHL